jgi:hypothetical protein
MYVCFIRDGLRGDGVARGGDPAPAESMVEFRSD